MKIHPTSIEGFDSLEDAAVAVGKMRYDAIAVFLEHLGDELERQQEKDENVGKKQLSQDTKPVLLGIGKAAMAMGALFQKYKKHMAKELEIAPEIEYNTE